MTRCLDEAMLQSYFDGELSEQMMEKATLHLASCSTCAAAARELEHELNVLMTALEPEFEVSVPTDRLRQRIDSAVLDLRIGRASSTERAGFGGFVSGLLNFGSQRTFGYASLVVLLALGAIFSVVKMRTTPEPPVAQTVTNNKTNEVVAKVETTPETPSVAPISQPVAVNNPAPQKNATVVSHPVKYTAKAAAPKPASVKLFPGERSYLQTIAKLDSTIKSDKKGMRPSLQVEYERNLAVVDRAIAATRSAAKSNPNDPDTADFMFAAYQSKVDFLNTIADARLGGGRPH